ncbi:aspartate--tRNA(Asn) ligase [Candidatus Undinarchaeota archaeon]
MTDEIGDWRRTGFSSDIEPGQDVVLMGWVHEVRLLGKINFFLLRDRDGLIQITAKKEEAPAEVTDTIKKLGREFVVAVKGKVVESKIAKMGKEVIPEEIRILNPAKKQLPLDVTGITPAELDTRLNARVVDLRRPEVLSIFKIRDQVFTSAREYLEGEGFIEVHTPKIIKAGAEGGATLFPISYFDQQAYLSQSPQLYKEILTSCFDRVYEISPFFRAEPSDTVRHISEFTGIDAELAFGNEEDAMKELENMFYYIVSHVKKECADCLEQLGKEINIPKPPYKRVTYDDALKLLEKDGRKIEWGEDIDRESETILGEKMKDPFFITGYPTEDKPFYIMPDPDRPEVSKSFDFDYGGIELSSGGMRVHDRKMLIENLKKKGQDPKDFEHHLNAFEWGMPPHAGWGVGGDRLVMVLTGVSNVRECIAFPRDMKRLVP